ncbi:MAG: hypothetical protein M9962_09745 [Oligoflexia bacterium]|nr:hypothetical protein [Oligoflexia bacterium]
MKFLVLFFSLLITSSAYADTGVEGELIMSLFGRIQCKTLKDTKGPASGYKIKEFKLSLNSDELTLGGSLDSYRCVLSEDKPTWVAHALGSVVEYNSFEATPRLVRLWFTNNHLLAINQNYQAIANVSLTETESQNISMQIPLSAILTEENRTELDLTGTTNTEFKFGLRSTGFYTLDNGPKQSLGQKSGGSYLVKLIFKRDKSGNLSVSFR